MPDYRDRLEPAVAATEPAPAPAYRSVEAGAMFSIAISLKRIADSLAGLTPEMLRQLVDASHLWSYPGTTYSRSPSATGDMDAPAAEASTKTDDNPWIDWPGGECPVPDGTLVDVRFRDGTTHDEQPAYNQFGIASTVADAPFWRNDDSGADIIAYRRSAK